MVYGYKISASLSEPSMVNCFNTGSDFVEGMVTALLAHTPVYVLIMLPVVLVMVNSA